MIITQNPKCLSVTGKDKYLFDVEIMVLKPGKNNNDWIFPEETLLEYGQTFRGKPILCAYKGLKIGDGHNFDEYIDPETMKIINDYRGPNAERIVGYIPANAEIELREIEGEQWLVVHGVLWAFYCAQLISNVIEKGFKGVSAEVNAYNIVEQDDGSELFEGWEGLGITILGDDVEPAVTGALLKQLADAPYYKTLSAKADKYRINSLKKGKGENEMDNIKKLSALCAALKGCTVLDTSDDEQYALIANEDGEPEICAFAVGDDGKCNVERFNTCVKACSVINGKECSFEIKKCVDKKIAEMQKKCSEAEQKMTEKDGEIARLKTRCAAMEESEISRRNDDVVRALKEKYENDKNDILEEGERIPEDKFNALIDEAKNGKYKDCVDENGKFIGTEKALQRYFAERGKCADEFRASRRKNCNSFAWQFAKDASGDGGEFDYDKLIKGLKTI